MKRIKYQELIAEAMKTPKIVDFVNAHPELMPEWSQNVWQVANADIGTIRAETGLTQGKFAAAVGTSLRTVAYWESGEKGCRLHTRLALAEMAGMVKVPLEW